MADHSGYRGSNLGSNSHIAVSGITPALGSKKTPVVVGAAAGLAGVEIVNYLNNMPVPGIVHHIPVVGDAIASGMIDVGHVMSSPWALAGVGVAAGTVGAIKLGRPIRDKAREISKKHGLG